MRVEISPSVARGKVCAPPSKSAAHRMMIAAALSEGCTVFGMESSEDIDATLSCLKTLGAKAKEKDGGVYLGALNPHNIPECSIDCRESGSTLRFLIPLCLIGGNTVTLKGHGRLLHRPLTEYKELCDEYGFDFELGGDELKVKGKLKSGCYRINGERSSQFITGMLFALPLLEGDSVLEIEGNAGSLSYIDLTLQVLAEFGIRIEKAGNILSIHGGQRYRAQSVTVEGDWSNAAFLEALNILGGDVTVTGLKEDSVQGDKIYREYFEKVGRETLDLSNCPDLAPILFALASLRGGFFTGCARLRLKESDRIAAMQSELQKCGVLLEAQGDNVRVVPIDLHAPDVDIDGHGDHRIVMAMSILLSKLGGSIEGAQAVSKSFRTFFEEIEKLGVKVHYAE